MKLSTRGRYATRALLDLACHWGEGPVPLKDIAQRQEISLNYLEHLITPLIIAVSIILGVFAVMNLPREEEPQISVPMFDIFVSYPGADSKEVEQRIVTLGERKRWEIPGVE